MYLHTLLSYAVAMDFSYIPYDVMKNAVCHFLPPGSLGRLGLVATCFQEVSQNALELYFMKNGEYNLNLLYDLYHHYRDAFEKESTKRLILSQLPELFTDCYDIQHKYEKCRNALFSEDHMSYWHISDAFPVLSCMLLKHKHFMYQSLMNMEHLCRPALIDAYIGSLRKISVESLEDLFKYADPAKLGPAFYVVDEKSEQLQRILNTGDFDFLLAPDQTVERLSVLYAISQAKPENMDIVLKIIGKSTDRSFLNMFIYNFIQYLHMKPISELLLPLVTNKTQRVPNIIDCTHYQDYYTKLKGEKETAEALKFLDSFSEGIFHLDKPTGVACRDLVEIALVHRMSEDLVQVLIGDDAFVSDMHLVITGLMLRSPENVLKSLLEAKFRFTLVNFSHYSMKHQIPLEIFKLLTKRMISDEATNFQAGFVVLYMFDASVPIADYIRYIVENWKVAPKDRHATLSKLKTFALCDQRPDRAQIAEILIKDHFEKGLMLDWSFNSPPKEVVEFFEAQRTFQLIFYLRKLKFTSPIMNSLGLTLSILSRRKGCEKGLRKIFNLDVPKAEGIMRTIQALIEFIASDFTPAQAVKFIMARPCMYKSDSELFDYFDTLPPSIVDPILAEFAASSSHSCNKFLGKLIHYHIKALHPISTIAVLKHITHARFSLIVINSPRLSAGLAHSEYYNKGLNSGMFFKTETE